MKKEKDEMQKIADFVYEIGFLRHTPRSGFWFMGSGKQSVAEHLYRTAMIAYALAYLSPKIDKHKVIFMALVHDVAEGRTSDLSYVHQRYGRLAESQAFDEIAAAVPFGAEMRESYLEEHARETPEAKLVKDADQLEWLASLREEEVKGNAKVRAAALIAYKRLHSPAAKKIGKLLLKTNPDAWWFNKNDKWFIDRKEEYRHMRRGKK